MRDFLECMAHSWKTERPREIFAKFLKPTMSPLLPRIDRDILALAHHHHLVDIWVTKFDILKPRSEAQILQFPPCAIPPEPS